MLTYTTLHGQVLDLVDLSAEERAFFDRCYALYQDTRTDWMALGALVTSTENPLLRPTGGLITRAIIETPLFRALQDLEDRVGIRTGDLVPDEGTEPELGRDPVGDAWLPVTDAAVQKCVHRSSLHAAIKRGDLLARKDPEGDRLLVSVRSLERWQPMAVRQAAGKASRTRRKGSAA